MYYVIIINLLTDILGSSDTLVISPGHFIGQGQPQGKQLIDFLQQLN